MTLPSGPRPPDYREGLAPDDILALDFYDQEVHALATELLGRDLVRRDGDALLVARIVEVEAYEGANDRASHGRSGSPTPRNWPMFGPPGHAYIYKIYGMYYCLNIVAPPDEQAAAVLIRAAEPLVGLETMAARRNLDVHRRRELLNGPGKLCQAFGLDAALNGLPLDGEALCLTRGEPVATRHITQTARIGLNPKTCGDATDYPWRYVVEGSAYLSRGASAHGR